MNGTHAYLDSGESIFVPEKRIRYRYDGHDYKALRGNAFTLAVMEGKRCVGWIDCHDLGYTSVKDFLTTREKLKNSP